MAVKIGNNDITLKLGSSDVTAAYIGDTLVYSGGTPPTPTFGGKWLATYTEGTTSSADCDASSAITQNEINLTDLVSVEIGNCVTSIGDYAFDRYTYLTSCTIGNSVTSIGEGAFSNCILRSIDIPDSVTSIGAGAFNDNTFLSSCTIGSGVTSIGAAAFLDCHRLTSITVNATTPPTLEFMAFEGSTCPIYVPCESVDAYKAAWSDYSSRIQAIPNS